MTVLVADVGGTNARLALVDVSGRIHGLARFRNDEHPSFLSVLEAYCAEHDLPELHGFCAAVAGPVGEGTARLTNRDWDFDRGAIAGCVPVSGAKAVRLINDLAALGYALPALSTAQLAEIKPLSAGAETNDQALVVGLGTGVNVCLVKGSGAAVSVVEAELGHASLPSRVFAPLKAAIGEAVADFPTVEELFSGRGLSRLYRVICGGQERAGQEILAAYDAGEQGAVSETVDLLAALLGSLSRELVYIYQPFGGIHFAGGVARGILGSAARAGFLHRFEDPGRFAEHSGRVAVRLITDDAAALTGAARVFANTGGPGRV